MEQKFDPEHISLNIPILERSDISKRFGELVNALDLNANKITTKWNYKLYKIKSTKLEVVK